MALPALFRKVVFLRGCRSLEDLPKPSLPEMAFAGRSNVGKSSLLNALCANGSLARTSNTPGRTRELNFFELDGKLRIVDMPGYGYAKASKSDIKQWTRLIRQYLAGRQALLRVFVLIDSRHGIKDTDREVMGLLNELAVMYQVVLTKVDKIKKAELETVSARVLEELNQHAAAYPGLICTSSAKGEGMDELRREMQRLLKERP